MANGNVAKRCYYCFDQDYNIQAYGGGPCNQWGISLTGSIKCGSIYAKKTWNERLLYMLLKPI